MINTHNLYYLVFDTETTGLPKNWDAPVSDSGNWPRCVQLAWQLHDASGALLEQESFIVKPEGYNIPFDAEKVHGISTALAAQNGLALAQVLEKFNAVLEKTDFLVGQNLGFDLKIVGAELHRMGLESKLLHMPVLDTCTEKTAELCKLPGGRGGKYKLPNLTELHAYLFGVPFAEAHNASADVEATARCFFELLRQGNFNTTELGVHADYFAWFAEKNPQPFALWGVKHSNLKAESQKIKAQETPQTKAHQVSQEELALLQQAPFAHLHNHTRFSILQATSEVDKLVQMAIKEEHSAVALTDLGNMMAAFEFVQSVAKQNKKSTHKIKPIVGIELAVCKDRFNKTNKDNGYNIVFLAKNKAGYHHLAKMASIAYTEGFYYVPRIDRSVVEQYKEHLICLSGGLFGEISSLILNMGEKQAEEALLYWKGLFGDDFYLEMMRHGQENEDSVNKVLVDFAQKHQVRLLASNNTFYLNQKDAAAHDILLCVKEGEKQSTPIGSGRGFRFGFPNQEYYFKSAKDMKKLFADLPQAILNIQHVVDKIETYELARPVLLPAFQIPVAFEDALDKQDGGKRGENAYLRHLTYQGASKRYADLSPEIQERLDFELSVIEKTGYPGYFLIVQDFITAARDMGVVVGPGRGSAAGSAVAYCIGITNIDPLRYGLLFERFLNPDRVSLPDIDIDFDDEGRQKVIDYVIKKYGANQVAQIITYGSMAAKSAIRDTARVLNLPLADADKLSKLMPDIDLKDLLAADDNALKKAFAEDAEGLQKAKAMLSFSKENNLTGETIRQAGVLEGSLRNTGTHACGIVITPDDITEFVPVAMSKDTDMWCTQFDNAVAESAGLLKMDFLGLKTLTIIRDACQNIKIRHNLDLDPDAFPIDDEKTYELFQRGDTIGIFQYESAGMQKYMRELKPTVFEDLVAMNALYRPGPLQYIPAFIRRKNKQEAISYDLEDSKDYLEETYGITVYQEQVMLLSQKLAGFTKGEADALRKAMGKKKREDLDKLKPKFIEQASAKGYPAKTLEKVWTDWEAFASYAFNKSHSVCYAWIAYQTAYLKANYPAEYMAAVLSHNLNDTKTISFFIEECKRMGVPVLCADVNESHKKFSVNPKGEIRFGLLAIKGVGEAAVENILQERTKLAFASIYDFIKRVDLRQVNKRVLESLALAGAFDGFPQAHRAQYFFKDGKNDSFLESLVKYAITSQNEQNQGLSLFGESTLMALAEPKPTTCEPWSDLEKLEKEKEVIGIYLSGHPLDGYRLEIDAFCNIGIGDIQSFGAKNPNRPIKTAGVLQDVQHKTAKNGNPYGTFSLRDESGEHKVSLFGEDYLRFKPFLEESLMVYAEGMFASRWAKSTEFEFKLQKIELLSDLKKRVKHLELQIDLQKISPLLLKSLQDILQKHQGDKTLILHLKDHGTEQSNLSLFSKKYKIDFSTELVKSIQELDIAYKIA